MVLAMVFCVGAAVLAAQGSAADVFSDAQWLRDPVFEGIEVIDIAHKQNAPKPELSGPRNVHTLFRHEIELPEKPVSATLFVTGDDYYKFYVNGRFVVQGPEAGYSWAHPYYSLDITDFLKDGKNCLAAHAYYQGLANRVWNSGDNRSGFMLKLELRFAQGPALSFVTDASWRCFHLEAFPTGRTIGYKTQFAEDIDMRQFPVGWRELGFDDSTWTQPLAGRQDHAFTPQLTPPLQHMRAEPVTVVKKADGHYFYDFGTEIVGHTRIRVSGPAGHRMEVRHGEELSAPDTVRHEMRANCKYQEYPVLAEGDNSIEFYDYRAFRYMEVIDAPSEPEVWVDARHHPFAPDASDFTCSDELLVRIWDLCRNGVRQGAQGGFLDCPSREKGQYLGDALIAGHSHLVLTGDGSLVKKALKDFALSQRICPGLMAVAPGSEMQEIAEYSLQWPMLLLDYYRYTGDRRFVEEMVDSVFDGLYDYFVRFENEAGLLTGMTEKWVLVDWPENLRDGYDYEYAKERENAVFNAFYHASLRAAAELLSALGRDPSKYESKARKVKKAFAEHMTNPATGLFLDAPGSTHSSLHANALPLAFGLAEEKNVGAILDLIRDKRLSCGVYIAPFVIQACYKSGEYELGHDLVASRDERSWHEMLKSGATTCMEAWGPDQKWNTSWCHPWSSSPIYLISEEIMGLKPAEPGWKSIRFAPRPPESLDHARITITTPRGKVTAHYERDKGFRLTVPAGVNVKNDTLEGQKVEIETHGEQAGLTSADWDHLRARDWDKWVGDGLGVWVSVDSQTMRVIEGREVVWQAPCSTAANGTGSLMNSFKTPLGWHTILRKTGDTAPWGQVFRSGMPVAHVWRPGEETDEDLVLTRILFLSGLESGLNKGGDVDSYARNIYVHGTNDEDAIGRPVSHGCVRLRNDDVISAYELLPPGTPLLISEEDPNRLAMTQP